MLNIEYRKVEALIPYARNARTHSDEQVANIVEYGWTNPVLVDGANGIIAGHGRLAAARKLGLAKVPVIRTGPPVTGAKACLRDCGHKLALDAGWDEELLALELAELSEAGYWSSSLSLTSALARQPGLAPNLPGAQHAEEVGDLFRIDPHGLQAALPRHRCKPTALRVRAVRANLGIHRKHLFGWWAG